MENYDTLLAKRQLLPLFIMPGFMYKSNESSMSHSCGTHYTSKGAIDSYDLETWGVTEPRKQTADLGLEPLQLR